MSRIICAIYTRKSSEEGLEQGFNSLDSQREACEAYVLSQQHEGWKALATRYDDGGYSGGNMERPALKQLLADISAKRIKVVVVYKVDRLTRSLADFAKIVEQFDALGVSFVSVTQQFNTTSSMGRLTLNVLLSFAQFEREVTGERIRDKIAASKQKGMWMGGNAPIGYIGHERTLAIDEEGADLIRRIFTRYLVLGCVRSLKRELDCQGVVCPPRTTKSGRSYGGQPISRGQLYLILSNPIYIGQIPHGDKVYPGLHPPIIEQEFWDAAQQLLSKNRRGYRERRSAPSASLLKGLVFDQEGNRLIPSHSQKQSKRYRYYMSEPLITSIRESAPDGIRIPAQELEDIVIDTLQSWLKDEHTVLDTLSPQPEFVHSLLITARKMFQTLNKSGVEQYRLIQDLIQSVVVAADSVQINFYPNVLEEENSNTKNRQESICLNIPVSMKRCGFGMRVLIEGQRTINSIPDARLIIHLSKAHDWLMRLTTGKAKSVGEIAVQEGITISHVTRMIYRICLAPDIIKSILDGTHPPSLTSETLKQNLPLPIDWKEQRSLLGFPQV
jgi:DNA invertase Pin-like site-specific DNA recombinase